MTRGACIYTYVLLSLVFIILNVITLSNLAPWIDEVMILDTSYNMAIHDSWETTAWYRVVGQYPFSTYPPLYQMLATVWIWIFGYSLVTVRSMNLLFVFMLGGICLHLMKRHGTQLTVWTVVLFTFLLWGTSEMAWMYRNGRPDMLCALTFAFTVLAIDGYLLEKTPTTRLAVTVSSAMLLCSGIQAAVYLMALWLFYFMIAKGKRGECCRLLILLLTGILFGTLLVALFMLSHGRLVAFASSIIQYSSTLSSIAQMVLPWIGDLFGFNSMPYTQKLQELKTESGIIEQLCSITEHRSFIILSMIALAAYATHFRNNMRHLLSDKGFLMLLCAFYVPFIMTIAGRYPIYYHWMAFIPLVTAILSIAARHLFWSAAFGVMAVLLDVSNMKSVMPDKQWNYRNICSFVQRQHFKSSDTVACPFSTFYEIKPVCDTCYFLGIFPTEFLGDVDYVIEAADGDEFDKPITNYVNKLKADTTVVLTAIDYCEQPSLTLYQVQTKYE